MTVKQAVKIRSIFANKLPHPNMHSEECNELTALLEEAIEKQIPKKAIPDDSICDGLCPVCGYGVFITDDCNYCSKCGQRVFI